MNNSAHIQVQGNIMNNHGGKRIGAGRPSNWNTQDLGSKSVRIPSVLADALLAAKDNQTDIRQLTAGVIALIGALKSTT